MKCWEKSQGSSQIYARNTPDNSQWVMEEYTNPFLQRNAFILSHISGCEKNIVFYE